MSQLKSETPFRRPSVPWVRVATRDAIRHFAWGVGDNNPLWTDLDHGAASIWHEIVAPPCFLYAVDETTVALGHKERRRLYRSVSWTFFDVVRVGTEITPTATLVAEMETPAGVEQTGYVDFRSSSGGLLARAETVCVRPVERAQAIDDRADIRYSSDELEQIERIILAEQRRGSARLYGEDVNSGELLGPLIKGPLSIMDVVAWSAGTTGVVDDTAGHSEGGVDNHSATGPEVVSWMSQLVTDWMGDEAFLHRLDIRVNALPILGATTTINGVVKAEGTVKNVSTASDPVSSVIELTATTQDGNTAAEGTATVLLPSRDRGPIRLPIKS